MMPAWVYIATAVWLGLEGLANVALVGKVREKTAIDAISAVILTGWCAYLLVAAVH